MTIPRLTIALSLAVCLAGPAWGQQPADNPLAALQAQTEIDQAGQTQIRDFITQQVAAINGTDAAAARQASAALSIAHTGTDAFKQAFSSVCLSVIGTSFKQAELLPATRLLTALNTLDALAAEPQLTEALRDPRAAVRAAGAVGLRRLRAKLAAAGEDRVQRVVSALADAGDKEKSAGAIATIYAAMDYTDVPGIAGDKIGGTALIGLLAKRAQLYSGADVQAFGADDTGLSTASKIASAVEEPTRQELATAAATMIKYALEQYTTVDTWPAGQDEHTMNPAAINRRNALERLIVQGEASLAAALTPPAGKPELAGAMQKLDKDALLAGWKEWGDVLKDKVGRDFALAEAP